MTAMTSETRDTIQWSLATLLAGLMLLGLAIRYVLVPYLRDHLVNPVKEVQKQVTENHHASPEQPTVLDRIEDVHQEVKALAHVMDTHMEWSEREHAVVSRKLKALRRQAQRQQQHRTGETHEPSSTT